MEQQLKIANRTLEAALTRVKVGIDEKITLKK